MIPSYSINGIEYSTKFNQYILSLHEQRNVIFLTNLTTKRNCCWSFFFPSLWGCPNLPQICCPILPQSSFLTPYGPFLRNFFPLAGIYIISSFYEGLIWWVFIKYPALYGKKTDKVGTLLKFGPFWGNFGYLEKALMEFLTLWECIIDH